MLVLGSRLALQRRRTNVNGGKTVLSLSSVSEGRGGSVEDWCTASCIVQPKISMGDETDLLDGIHINSL